jgi:hypothetical protein
MSAETPVDLSHVDTENAVRGMRSTPQPVMVCPSSFDF